MKTTTLSVLVFFCSLYSWSQDANYSITFPDNSDQVSQSELNKLGSILKDFPNNSYTVGLIGHTDSDGSESYNLELSKRRAEYINQHLTRLGYRIKSIDWKGEFQQLNKNQSEAEKLQNRRVELQFFMDEDGLASGVKSAGDWHDLPKGNWDLLKLRKYVAPEQDMFCIDNRKDTLIACEEGSLLYFPAYCFEDYNPMQCVEIRVAEAHHRSDMILAGLNTKSDGDNLQSGGMIRVSAWQNDRELMMKDDKAMSALIPEQNPLDNMRVFLSEDSPVNWREVDGDAGRVWPFFQTGFNSFYRNRERNWQTNQRCRFFFCRIGRAFQSKEKRRPLSDSGTFLNPEYEYVMAQDSAMIMMMEELGMNEDQLYDYFQENQAKARGMNYYAFSSTQLGWINCDFFIGRSLRNLIVSNLVQDDVNISAEINMIFPREDVIMPATGLFKNFSFYNVPKNREVQIIALGVCNGHPCISLKNDVVAEELSALEFELVDEDKIEKMVKQFIGD